MVAVDFETLAGIAAVTTLPIGTLAGLFSGWQAAAVVFVVGWLLVVPLFGLISEEDVFETEDEEPEPTSTPLDELRDRYARGEIGEAEFERRLERLLETEEVEPPSETRVATEPESTASLATERDR